MAARIPKPRRLALVAAVVALAWLAQQAGVDLSARDQTSAKGASEAGARASTGEGIRRIERAVEQRESGFMVTVDASVMKLLRDDLEGSRHQRLLVSLDGGRTLLVVHNIDLARRIPAREGDALRVRGQYEWNERGGLLHWTHHDPAGRHPGGFIEHAGVRIE